MSDWAPGDLGLCLKVAQWLEATIGGRFVPSVVGGPRAGEFVTVRAVGRDEVGDLVLWLEGWPGDEPIDGFLATRFRKIRPHKPDAEDLETIRLLTGEPVFETYPQALHQLRTEAPNPLDPVGSDFIHSLETSAGGATKHA